MAGKDTASITFTRRELYFIENSMSCATPNREDMGPEERSAYDKINAAHMRLHKRTKR